MPILSQYLLLNTVALSGITRPFCDNIIIERSFWFTGFMNEAQANTESQIPFWRFTISTFGITQIFNTQTVSVLIHNFETFFL